MDIRYSVVFTCISNCDLYFVHPDRDCCRTKYNVQTIWVIEIMWNRCKVKTMK